jgi:hypothetical protein
VVFRAFPRRDSRSLLIICVISRKRTARVTGDHHGRDAATRSRGGSAAGECVIEPYATRASELQVGSGRPGDADQLRSRLFEPPLAVRFTAGRADVRSAA